MNGEKIMVTDVLRMLLTNPVSVFLIALLATLLNFKFLKAVPNKMKENMSGWTIVFGGINGLFAVLVFELIKIVAPVWVMLIFPFIIESISYYRILSKVPCAIQ